VPLNGSRSDSVRYPCRRIAAVKGGIRPVYNRQMALRALTAAHDKRGYRCGTNTFFILSLFALFFLNHIVLVHQLQTRNCCTLYSNPKGEKIYIYIYCNHPLLLVSYFVYCCV